ncbi:FadR/GntR family transcriptional regulator [Lichenibacterium dinghuense]|uniref:FadR/GntR family transcriptional regulator n=1 Tax=Lichenibacterium dinghuense TaxID=2895977 RepID=UPI001F1D3038|nr:FCD domain-containing protein [Lichenibacterium sp. 6Y81]
MEPRSTAKAGTPRLSAVDRLVGQIRALVADRNLGVGDPIPTERELGDMFAASRNTVREALVVLRAYGLVETRPKSGAVIAGGHAEAVRRVFSFHLGVSRDGFRDVQGFRRLVEAGVGDEVMRRAEGADLDRLEAINDRLAGAETVAERAREDYAFHEALVALSGNRTTLEAFRMLRPVIEEIMRVGKAGRAVQADTRAAHAGIVSALRERDRVAYAYLVGQHLDYGLRFVPGADEGPGAPPPAAV